MPGGDGTGPGGMGPMTGRAAGYCAGYPVPGFMNPIGGRLGMGSFGGYPARRMPGAFANTFYGQGGYPPYAGAYGARGRPFGMGLGRGRGRGRRW